MWGKYYQTETVFFQLVIFGQIGTDKLQNPLFKIQLHCLNIFRNLNREKKKKKVNANKDG